MFACPSQLTVFFLVSSIILLLDSQLLLPVRMTPGCNHDPSPPRLIYWELTTGCNLRCTQCATDSADLLTPGDLNYAESCCVIDQLAEYAPLSLVLSGGEPLWRRDLFALAQHARNHHIDLTLVTNGTLIDEPMAARIQAVEFDRVAVTLDGADAATHDGFRGQPGAFRAATHGLRLLHQCGVTTQINATVTRHNAHQLAGMLALAEQLNVAALHVFLLVPIGCGFRIQAADRLRGDEVDEILGWLYNRSLHSAIEIRATCGVHTQAALRCERSATQPRGVPLVSAAALSLACLAGRGICFLSHSGEVYPCSYLPVSAGNLRKEKFRDIWNHAANYDSLRHLQEDDRHCACGRYSAICSGCTRSQSLSSAECLPAGLLPHRLRPSFVM